MVCPILKYHTAIWYLLYMGLSLLMINSSQILWLPSLLCSGEQLGWVRWALSAREESVTGCRWRSRFDELFLKHTETKNHPTERETELTWETAVIPAEELLVLLFESQTIKTSASKRRARGRRLWSARSWRQLSHLRPEARQLAVPVPLTKLRWNARSRINAPFLYPKRAFTLTYPYISYMIYTIIMI